MNGLLQLSPTELRSIAAGLRTGRLSPPFLAPVLRRHVASTAADDVVGDLQAFSAVGMSPEAISRALDLLAGGYDRRPRIEDLLELVTTGPEAQGVANRDTSVVVRELFGQATETVLISGYRIYQGQEVFRVLGDRMNNVPALKVKMFLDIERKWTDTTRSDQLVLKFVKEFQERHWPRGCRLPEVYFDPRSLEDNAKKKAVLHAKCVVVDQQQAFVSSANFTEAAQERNIEVGLLVRSPRIAERITQFFEAMAESGHLRQVI